MALLLLAAFIGVPLIEIAVFIEVGGAIGLGWTLLIVVATAVAGTWLLRAQGFAVLERARRQMEHGVLPARELFDGVCLLFAGALLLTPGFVTDSVGLLLFVPGLRELLRRLLLARLARSAREGRARVWIDGEEIRPGDGRGAAGGGRRPEAGVIEGDYVDLTEDETRPPAPRRGNGHDPDRPGPLQR